MYKISIQKTNVKATLGRQMAQMEKEQWNGSLGNWMEEYVQCAAVNGVTNFQIQ
jgi:hypothetical protein